MFKFLSIDYDANWVVTPSGGYTDPAMTLTIHGDGIPGKLHPLQIWNVSAATTIATGVWLHLRLKTPRQC